MERGVMMMPAIIIDGDLKISAGLPDVPEIKKFLAGLCCDMAATAPPCSCTSMTGPAGPTRIIFPCAGQANTGQLTNLAALQLTEEGYGEYRLCRTARIGAEGLLAKAKKADEVIVLFGCTMHVPKKIPGVHGIVPGQHIVVTDLDTLKPDPGLYR